jgi:hypothetical protein
MEPITFFMSTPLEGDDMMRIQAIVNINWKAVSSDPLAPADVLKMR